MTVIDAARKKQLQAFEAASNTRFRRHDLLNLAFIHRSHLSEQPDAAQTNERLEFLGDSVLGLVVADYLYATFPDKAEGDLARIKSVVVSEETLAGLARELGIPELLLLGKGEECSGGRDKKAILADALEALVGALFLDRGLEAARDFVLARLETEIRKVAAGNYRRDYKTLLQEACQKTFRSCPVYVMTGKSGPDHQRTYRMAVKVGDQQYGPAEGTNKKEAEQGAARMAWEILFGE